MEISQANIHDTSLEIKTKFTNDVMRLLQVRDKNEDMAKDWLLFLTTTSKFNKLTPGEIYEAFKLAMSREILQVDGKEFNLLPELSINTTSAVLIQYMNYKKLNPEYNKAKNDLMLLEEKKEPDEAARQRDRENFIKFLFKELNEKEVAYEAWLLWDELSYKIPQTDEQKKNLYKQQEHIYLVELKQNVSKNRLDNYAKEVLEIAQKKAEKGSYINVVRNRCRSILISNFLKPFKGNYEDFKNAIQDVERS